jgi:NAD(P)-dependent dehydrogenase (short-subunit alcohol dehydrogenase family)
MSPVILITGASRGLGAAIVSYLLEKSSAKLVLVSRNAEALQVVKSANPNRVDYLATDVAATSAPANIQKRVKSSFGRLDSVIVNHGVLEPVAKLVDTDIDAWREGFDINFFAVVALVRTWDGPRWVNANRYR